MNTQTTTDGIAAGPAGPDAVELPAGAESAERVVGRVVALLEQHWGTLEPGSAALDELAAAARCAGLGAQREQALLAGGTTELLVTPDGVEDGEDGGVAVVVAEHGASDALRGRLRQLGAHREIAAVVLATSRPRHRALSAEVRQVPVRVVVLARDDRRQPWCSASAGASRVPSDGGPG